MTSSQAARAFTLDVAEGEIAGLRFGAPGADPLVFLHANGFSAWTYRRLFEAMGEAMDVFALDLRGHGRTRLPTAPRRLRDWRIFAGDLNAAVSALSRRFGVDGGWTLAGHSIGAITVLLASEARRDVRALRLVEPVIMPAPHWLVRTPLFNAAARFAPLVRAAKARRDWFESRAVAHVSYAEKPVFARWAPGVLEDYLTSGFVDAEGGGVRLACEKAWETAIYTAQGHNVWRPARAAARAGVAIDILLARRGSTLPRAAAARLERLGARLARVSGGHLLPMETPDVAAAFLAGGAALVQGAGNGAS